MNICNSHDEGEVCYESRECPACEIEKRLQGEVDTLKEKVQELQDENETLTKECEDYQQKIDAEPQERP